MQSLFDISMPAPVSYIVAVLVILGLLAIFAMIVRRVAAQGPYPESNSRGRGPRLGLVDTFSLDKDRQLIIVRRDNVEHLLMVGGSNDVVIETNIVRAMAASGLRDQSFQNLGSSQTSDAAPQPTQAAPTFDIPTISPPVSAPAPQMPQASMPRLRPAQPAPSYSPPVQPVRSIPESDDILVPLSAPVSPMRDYEPAPSAPAQPAPSAQEMAAQARQAINQTELVALAKRLEASIPSIAPRSEKPTAPPIAPITVQAPPVQAAPTIESSAPEPLSPAPSFAPYVDASRPIRQPVMPHVSRPTAPAPLVPPLPQESAYTPTQISIEPSAIPDMVPIQSTIPMPEPPKDRQAAALDENLRRLLGRKIEPRS